MPIIHLEGGKRLSGLAEVDGQGASWPSLQFGVCMWLKPDEPSCFMGEAEHVTLASVKVANSCIACLRQNITEEGQLNSCSEE